MKKILLTSMIAALTTSCASTFVEKDSDWQPKEQVPALMVHFSVVDKYHANKSTSIMDVVEVVVDSVNGASGSNPLEIAAKKSLARVKPIFTHNDMKIYFDEEAANKAADIEGVIKQSRNNKNENQSLFDNSNWLHADTVEEPFHMAGTFFQDKYYKMIATETLGENKDRVAVSMGMEFDIESSWYLGWTCTASFRSRALDADGKPVFLVSSSGESSTHWFGGKDDYLIDACPEAAENALQELAKVETGTL